MVLETLDKNESKANELLIRINSLSFRYNQPVSGITVNLLSYSNRMLSKKLILDNCSINVPKGKIYSLLGSSGCGKTTLLKCILGIIQPIKGDINIFMNKKKPTKFLTEITGSNVGYMPQELALMNEITIEENLKYFGQLHGMSMKLIEERIHFLLKFLEIKDKTRVISSLSGGQQRRVSLATAMLHNPLLLILDEPTVGLDSILRHSIWQYLETLCRLNHITVIITTHYIGEARNSHNIGLMRGGSLIVEGNPDNIMKQYSCHNMEDVFLVICLNRPKIVVIDKSESEQKETITDNLPNNSSNEIIALNNDNFSNDEKFKKRNFCDVFSHIRALIYKNWLVIRRNPRTLLFVYLLPSIQISLFALTLGLDPHDIPVAVYNPDSKPVLSDALLGYMNDTNMIKEMNYDSLKSGVDSVISGKTWALISLPHNYSDSFYSRVEKNLDASDATIEFSSIGLHFDTTNLIITVTIIKSILKSLIRLIDNYFSNQISLQTIVPIDISEVIYGGDASGSLHSDMTQFMAPGMLMATIFVAPWPFVLFVITKEKKIKFLSRSIISGATSYEILLSILILQLLILFTQVIALMFTSFYLLEFQNHGNLILVFGLLYLEGVMGILFAIIITSMSGDEGSAFVLTLGIVLPLWFCSGILWPTESLSKLGYQLVHLSPLTYPIDGLRCIMIRGWFIEKSTVFLSFVFSAVYIVIFFILAVIIYKFFITAD